MLKLFFEFCTYALAAYGALCLFISFFKCLKFRTSKKDCKIGMVLLVKNAEKVIEGIVRCIFIENIIGGLIPAERFLVMDMGSSDKTADILKRLEKEYRVMEFVDDEGKDKIFNLFT